MIAQIDTRRPNCGHISSNNLTSRITTLDGSEDVSWLDLILSYTFHRFWMKRLEMKRRKGGEKSSFHFHPSSKNHTAPLQNHPLNLKVNHPYSWETVTKN
ncbi:hypothetical protein NPIL_624451 [Nephila pilipes]|uniref:Uncharacterized protein n=1 Tax=Nephila pilipes TaxID=299642 RepID=A0A8X6NA25_NEPPI|nr:hypothetical protein NPIL_624451 [Nephila pilipes]